MKSLILLLLSAAAAFGQAWSYIGIPYPTDNVPGAIMPVLPTGADTPGWPYDPCTIATPVFADGATQYYVDSVNGNNGTAGNSGRGSVALPRQTVPGLSGSTWVLTAGMQVFITGNSTLWGAQTDKNVQVSGTAADPCWIIGVGPGKPNFGGDEFFLSGQHLLMDNIRFQATDGKTRVKIGENVAQGGGGPMQYCTLRYCTMTGLGTSGSGENAVLAGKGNITTPSAFVCIYRCEISNFGRWNRPDTNGVDRHGIQPLYYTRYWWIIENAVYHMEGDSVQLLTSGTTDGIYAKRPHYIYIAGNDFYENYEQSVDNKNSFHLIVSQNRCRYSRNPYLTKNNSCILINNDEGWLSDYQWIIFNHVDDSGKGIFYKGDAASQLSATTPPVQITGQKGYIIGNLITNCSLGIYFEGGDTSGLGGTNPPASTWTQGVSVVNNTIQTTGASISQLSIAGNAGHYATYEISGNLLYKATATPDIVMKTDSSSINTINVLRNLSYSPAGAVTFSSTGAYDSLLANLQSTNPLVANPPGDMSLTVGSPAIGANEESPVYQLFHDMYGIDIQKSFSGQPRPLGGTWDIGAFEFGDEYIPPTLAVPVNSVAPVITGTPTQGQTLAATTGTWSNGPTYAYQWTRNAVDIAGSTASTHLLGASDAGTVIRVRVTATTTGGSASATSAPTASIAGPPPPPEGVATAVAVDTAALNVGP